jgi:DNA-binding SARP family transcriptional activator
MPSCPRLFHRSEPAIGRAMIDIRVLGTVEIRGPQADAPVLGLTQPRQVALLLYLALAQPPGPQSRASLMAFLWPEADEESARHSLRNTLYGLRRALGDRAFVARGAGYVGLEPGAVSCDALEVRRLLAEHRWNEAVAAWDGELAPGLHVSEASEFEHWLDGQRASLRQAVAKAAWRSVDELERSGDPGLVAAARKAWTLEPTNEDGARRLMHFVDAAEGRTAALRVYEDLAEALRRELEAEPSAETRALAQQLRGRVDTPGSQAPSTLRPASEPPASRLETREPPAASPTGRRPLPALVAIVVAGVVGAAAMLVLALRPKTPTTTPNGAAPAARAEQPSALRLPLRFRRDTVAYRSYLRGLALLFRGDHVEARDSFASLTEREPLYAPAFAGLAHAYDLMVVDGLIRPANGMPKAEAAARRGLALDSAFASSYLALAAVEIFWRWNLPRARQLIDRAIALDPTDPETHALRGVWFRWRGEMDSAVAEARISQRLDPLSSLWSIRLGRQLVLARRYPEAEATFRQTLEDYPPDATAYYGLSAVYRATGRMREAQAMRRAAKEVEGDSLALAAVPLASSDSEAARMFADRERRELRDIVAGAERGDFVPPNKLAAAYASMHDREATLRWLDSMRIERDPMILNVPLSSLYDWLRDDPGYRAWDAKLTWRHPGAAALPDTAATAR